MSDNITPIRAARSARSKKADQGPGLTAMFGSWVLALRSGGRSEETIKSYARSVDYLSTFLETNGLPGGVEAIDRTHIRAFLIEIKERTSPGTAALHFRNLRAFFNWLIEEGERRAESPVRPGDRPEVPERDLPPFAPDEVVTLLGSCRGTSFADRRDTAIIMLFLDTGMRVSGMAGLRYHPTDDRLSDVRLHRKQLRITLKGGDELRVPIGKRSAVALDKYIRTRARHLHADSPWLWLGTRGHGVRRMKVSGIEQMLKRRGRQVGLSDVYPHRFRRTFADQWYEAGGNTDDLMEIAGWRSPDMPRHYAKFRRKERARLAHERLSPADRILNQ